MQTHLLVVWAGSFSLMAVTALPTASPSLSLYSSLMMLMRANKRERISLLYFKDTYTFSV